MAVVRWGLRPAIAASVAFFILITSASASSSAATFSVDSLRVDVGGTAVVPVRLSAPPPGISGYRFDVRYDPAIVTVTGCTPASFCSISSATPGLARFAGLSGAGIAGDDNVVGRLSIQVPGHPATTVLTLDPETIQAFDTRGEPVPHAAVDGTLRIVSDLLIGDVDCDGAIDAADALILLGEKTAACTPPGDLIDGVPWGDLNCSGLIDGADALAILRYLTDLGPPPAPCPPLAG
jgi:hypothetical protein